MFAAIAKAQSWFEDACAGAGYTLDLLLKALARLVYLGRKRREAVEQLALCTLGSLAVVFITSLFTGMIVSLQTGQVLRDFSQEESLGFIVVVGMCREMGPPWRSRPWPSRSTRTSSARSAAPSWRAPTSGST